MRFLLVRESVLPCSEVDEGRALSLVKRSYMGAVTFIVLTVGIFAVLGVVQKLVERL